jgi:hypothetical protein
VEGAGCVGASGRRTGEAKLHAPQGATGGISRTGRDTCAGIIRGRVKAPDEVDPLSETDATREAVDQDDAPAGAPAPKKTTRKRTAKKTTTKKTTTKKTTTAGHDASSKKSGAAGRGAPGVRKKPAAEVPEEGDGTEKEREEE